MSWLTRFFIFLPVFIIFVIFASDHEFAEVPESIKDDVKSQEAGTGKVLVEVTDAIEDEEEEEEALVYTPSIAPATPQVLVSSSKYIHDVSNVVSHIKAGVNKPIAVINDRVSDSSGGIETENKAAGENQSFSISPVIIAPSSSSAVASTLSTPIPPTFSKVTPGEKGPNLPTKEDDSFTVLKIDNEKLNEETIKKLEHNDIDQHNLPSAEKGHGTKSDDATKITYDVISKDLDAIVPAENGTKLLPSGSDGEVSNENLTEEQKKAEYQKKDQDGLSKGGVGCNGVLKDNKIENKLLEIEPGIEGNNVPKVEKETLSDEKKEVKVVEIKEDQGKESEKKKHEPVVTNIEKPDEDSEKTDVQKKMLSFAEWKKEKEEEDTINQSRLISPKNKTILKKKNKIKKNFASIDCGGKVIAANEEASNILSVLKEDKDIYMLNPCNVKAWFVVELCDRIQVDSIDLANFEMFSSTPEIFNVYVTSRYPSGSWEKVDTFHAKPEKQVQTFVFGEIFYAKYIKIEIKKYFGNEHYCPLSLLRVFGITEVEQFEDSDEHESSHEDANHEDVEHIPDEKNSEENTNANIFEAAKNVVAGLVNGMAIKLSGKTNLETNNSIVAENSAVVTVTSLSNENDVGEQENSTRYFKDSIMIGGNSVTWEMWYYYRYPKRTCPITDPKHFIKEIKATMFFDNNSTHISNIYTKISSSMSSNYIHAPIVPTPDATFASKPTPGSKINVSVFKGEITPTAVHKSTSNVDMSTTKASIATTLLDGVPVENSSVKLGVRTTITTTTTTESNIEKNDISNLTSIESSVKESIDNEESADVLHFKVNETVNGSVVAEKIIPNVSNPDLNSQNITNENLTSSLKDLKKLLSDNVTSLDSGNATQIDVQQKSTNNEHSDTTKSEQDLNAPNTPQGSIEIEKQKIPEPASDVAKINDTDIEIPSNSNTKLNDKKSDYIPEYSVEKDIPSTKTTSGSKESIIAKLNSKVKGLEANLTMSMMYLDEMSERYQTAVEKVDERHKKKYATLNASFNFQQELIKNQSKLILNLTNQIYEIQFQIQNLTRTTQDQHQKMIETHATWVFLEIVFILVFLLLCRTNRKSYNNNSDDESPHHRRYSEPVMMRNKKVSGIERQMSEPAGGNTDHINSQLPQPSVFLAKKRKRKKNSKITSELEGNSSTPNISVVTEKVGPVFGCNWMYGLAGAFKRKSDSTEKISRQADALIDEVSDVNSFDGLRLRKVKSSELPVIHENNDGHTIMERPKSCNDLEYYRKCS